MACFESLGNFLGAKSQLLLSSFRVFFYVRKTKRIAKFDSLEPRRCKDMEEIVASEVGPRRFGKTDTRLLEAWIAL